MPAHTTPPILSCAEAKEFEAAWFAGDEEREWAAMQQAGRAVADALLLDYNELGAFPSEARVLVLVGKGHNGGDALLAARRIVDLHPQSRIDVVFACATRDLRPLAARAWTKLLPVAASVSEWESKSPSSASLSTPSSGSQAHAFSVFSYDVVIDGVFGFQFRPPLDPATVALIKAVNALPIRFRAAVDLPSGLDDASAFRADFTYATGLIKASVLNLSNAGRIRFLDIGFDFTHTGNREISATSAHAKDRVLTSAVLDPLRALRSSQSDKRTYGHIFIIGGSRHYPGAVLMSVMAALHSGAGLVTAFVPESLAPVYASRLPEAMWVGWPETPEGGLALEGAHLLRAKLERADALLIGPGLGREAETLALVKDIVAQSEIPLVIDADALQPAIVSAGKAPRILTPHAGEFERIAKAIPASAVVIKKGPLTSVLSGEKAYHSFFGGPVLARGGSGDILAGLVGGLLVQTPDDPLLAAQRGTVWHGLAADNLARARGQVAVTTTQLLDYLGAALRVG